MESLPVQTNTLKKLAGGLAKANGDRFEDLSI